MKRDFRTKLERLLKDNDFHSFLLIAFPNKPMKAYRTFGKGDLREIGRVAEAHGRWCLQQARGNGPPDEIEDS